MAYVKTVGLALLNVSNVQITRMVIYDQKSLSKVTHTDLRYHSHYKISLMFFAQVTTHGV